MLEPFVVHLIIFFRVIGFVFSAPLLGSKFVPGKVKIYLSLVMAFMVYLFVEPEIPENIHDLYFASISNLFVGIFIGLLLTVMISFLNIGGHFVAMGSGLGFATLADPVNGGETTTLASFYKICGSLLFVQGGGLLVMFLIIGKSFTLFPYEMSSVPKIDVYFVLEFFKFAFENALLLAAPMLFVTFLMNLSIGVVSKASPALNIISVGFPVGILTTFLFMYLTVNTVPFLIQTMLSSMPILLFGSGL